MTPEELFEKPDPGLATTGEEAGWRWALVGDLVALDNRPAVDGAGPLDRTPEYQSVIVPKGILARAIERRRFVGG